MKGLRSSCFANSVSQLPLLPRSAQHSFFLISFLQQSLGLVLESCYFILWSRKLFSTFLHIQLFLLLASSHPQDFSCLWGQEVCAKFPPSGIIILHLRQSRDFAGQSPCVVSTAVEVRKPQDLQARGTLGALQWLRARSTGMASVFGPLNCICSALWSNLTDTRLYKPLKIREWFSYCMVTCNLKKRKLLQTPEL